MVGLAEAAPAGRIDRLEVENFKSYRGRHVIGPFRSFTAVIGPNGSGKSNLMDAISFVLGVRTAHLRGSLKELLYTNSQNKSQEDQPTRGFVKLVFVTGDGEEIEFSRTISPTNSSESTFHSQYKINSHTVTGEAYNAKLQSFGILVKARNFLVFQGDIESVAAMNPKELTAMFEAVSGSAALQKDYEAAEAAKNAAEERSTLLFARKKLITQDKKQKKEQKQEAEKHMHLQQELDDLKVEYYLWQLFQIDAEAKRKRNAMAGEEAEVARLEEQHVGADAELKKKRAEQAGFVKERMLLERKIAKARAQVDKKNPHNVQVKEEMMRLTKRVKVAEKELADKRKQAQARDAKIAGLERDLEQIKELQEDLEATLAQEAAKGGLTLDQGLLDRYNALKEEAGAKTCRMATDRDTAATRLQADKEALRNLEDTVKSVSSRLEQLENDKAESKKQEEKLGSDLAAADAELKTLKDRRKKLEAEHRQAGAQREFLTSKLDEVEGKLKEAKADRRENDRERKMKDALVKMKETFSGVYGRVTELANATDNRYNLALAVLLGRDMDSVIVDTEATARECIKYLRDHLVPPMTFYPLQSVKFKPVNERLRHIGGTSKLVLDILEFDPTYERAFLSICGNTLVCDTEAEAKRLAFGTERHKVVALDGTLINRAGVMTGGLSHGLESRARRWDEKVTGTLKQERAKYVKDLAGLASEREAAQAEQQVASSIAGLENKVGYLQQDMAATQARLQRLHSEIEALQQEQEKQAPGIERLNKAVADRENRIKTLDKRINDIKDRIFAAFSKEVKVGNIREYESQHLARAEQANLERMKLKKQAAKISSSLTYEKRADADKAVADLEAEIQQAKERLKTLKKEEEAFVAVAKKVEGDLAGQAAQVAALNVSAEKTEKEAAALRKAAAARQAEVAKAKRALGQHQATLDQLQARRTDALKAAAMDQVELPKRDTNGATPMEEDEDEEQGEAPTGGEALEGNALDYSNLSRQHRVAVKSAAERDKTDTEFRNGIDELSSRLERTAPNLKAVEQYEAIREKEAEQAEEVEEARAAAKEAAIAFNAIRTQRFDLFMAAFDHVSARIDPIFKELTRSRQHVGGQAYLSLHDTEEPFLHGIKFTAMPPAKRYRDMDQLSGGEKTLSALALLFAIHSFQPSPFFVLDEIDAALDALNVARIANYIREKTRNGTPGGFQSIVISLKDIFFEKADSLVGVTREQEHGASAILTFDLNRQGTL